MLIVLEKRIKPQRLMGALYGLKYLLVRPLVTIDKPFLWIVL
jgi:hypothetical protein